MSVKLMLQIFCVKIMLQNLYETYAPNFFLWNSCSKICMKLMLHFFFIKLVLQNLYETHAPIFFVKLMLQNFYETHTPKFLWNSYSKIFVKLMLQSFYETKVILPQFLVDWLCIHFWWLNIIFWACQLWTEYWLAICLNFITLFHCFMSCTPCYTVCVWELSIKCFLKIGYNALNNDIHYHEYRTNKKTLITNACDM